MMPNLILEHVTITITCGVDKHLLRTVLWVREQHAWTETSDQCPGSLNPLTFVIIYTE